MHDGTLEKKHGHELAPLKCISAIGEYDIGDEENSRR